MASTVTGRGEVVAVMPCSAYATLSDMNAQSAAAPTPEFKHLHLQDATRLAGAICQIVSTLSSYRNSAQRRRRQRRSAAFIALG